MKEISMKTKREVMERQNHRSITGVWLNSIEEAEFHHVIKRGSGSGVGLAYNIVALTPMEHFWFHNHEDIKVNGGKRYSYLEFEIIMKNYLKIHYPGWKEEYCHIHKYWEEDDYWGAVGKCSGVK